MPRHIRDDPDKFVEMQPYELFAQAINTDKRKPPIVNLGEFISSVFGLPENEIMDLLLTDFWEENDIKLRSILLLSTNSLVDTIMDMRSEVRGTRSLCLYENIKWGRDEQCKTCRLICKVVGRTQKKKEHSTTEKEELIEKPAASI